MTHQMIKDEFKNYLQQYHNFNSKKYNVDKYLKTNIIYKGKEKLYTVYFTFLKQYIMYFDSKFTRVPTAALEYFQANIFQ